MCVLLYVSIAPVVRPHQNHFNKKFQMIDHNRCLERPELLSNQLLQLCMARTVLSILVTVRLYTVMAEVCRWLTNEKQRKSDRRV